MKLTTEEKFDRKAENEGRKKRLKTMKYFMLDRCALAFFWGTDKIPDMQKYIFECMVCEC